MNSLSIPTTVMDKDILNLEGIEQQKKDSLLELIFDTIVNQVIIRILSDLIEEKQKEFEIALNSEDETSITTFLSENTSGYPQFFSEEISLYKTKITETIKTVKNLKPQERENIIEDIVKNTSREAEYELEASYSRSFISKLTWWLNHFLEQKEYTPEQIKKIAIDLLSYQDIDLNELNEDKREEVKELLKKIADNVENGTDTSKNVYSQVLLEATDIYGEDAVHRLADTIYNELHASLQKIPNFRKNIYSTSKSWPLWDLAKQYYYFKHPEESSPEYRIANPFTDLDKQQEIIDRHLGWEINLHRDTLSDNYELRELWENSLQKAEIETLLSKPLEEDLSSSDLAKLGVVIRTILPQT